MFTLSTPHFEAVQSELSELDLDSSADDYGECWDEIFQELVGLYLLYFKFYLYLNFLGTRPTFPYWFNAEIKSKPEFRPLFDVFISCTTDKATNRPSASELLDFIN